MQQFYRILLILLLLCVTTVSFGRVTAHVDRTKVALGESLTLTIATPNNSSKPDLTPLKKAFQLYGTTESSQMSIINGKLTASHQIIVTLMPKQGGILSIPAITVGKDKTQPLTITVNKPSAKPMAGKQRSLFLRASLSAKKTYINIPIIYTLKLYYATDVTGGSLSVPQSDAFSMVPYGKKISYSDNISGTIYRVVEQRYLLTPTTSGDVQIKPSLFSGSIAENNQNNNFFGLSTGKPVATQTSTRHLTVNAIPKSISPLQWLPAENVTLTSEWSSDLKHLKTGTPITRTVTLTAKGIQSKSLPTITFPTPVGFNAYPDKPQSSDEIINNTLVAKKQYKIAYLPTQSGKLTFPTITLPWWNTKTYTAQVKTLPAVHVTVAINTTVPIAQHTKPLVQQNMASISTNVMPKKTVSVVVEKTSPLWKYVATGFALLWVLTLLLWWYFSKRGSGKDPNGDKAKEQQVLSHKKALKDASKRLQQACNSNATKQIQADLINWAKLFWRDDTIYSLYSIKKYTLDPELLDAIENVEHSLYGHKPYNDGSKLWQAIDDLIVEKNKRNKQTFDLKTFYPE